MSQHRQEESFDLARFVLGYLEHEGSIVAPPAYGMHEVLLPDELASQLHVEPYQRLAFEVDPGSEALRLSVNHPLVEAIAERLAQEAGHARVYISHVRLEKKGLFDVAARALSLPNGRLGAKRNAVEQAALHHYLRFNFKVTFISDEKQEQIISVVMDVQGGHAVRDTEVLQRLVSYETEPAFPDLAVAQPRWQRAGDALAPATLEALLPRVQAAAEAELAGRLAALQARMGRFLELDEARIEDYYNSLERDLKQRLARAETVEEERRRDIESKIEALHAERNAKLADIQARYHLRVELELINVLLVVQPKVLLPVEIGNRRVTITRLAVWDPLVHRLEPMVCDRCGEPGDELHLCTGGHLAHRRCLAPHCIDCNREYCQLCADQVLACVVCDQPVCRASLQLCPSCGRGTCAEHQRLCHEADGQPVSLKDLPAAQQSEPEAMAPPPKPEPKPREREPAKRSRPAPQRRRPPPSRPAPSVKAVRLNVEIYEDFPRVVAFVMRSTNLVLASRKIELTPEGILVNCSCEKSPCPADGWIHRPGGPGAIQEQVKAMLSSLRREYYLPSKRVQYFYIRYQQVTERKAFVLPPIWRDERLLADARRGFDRSRDSGS